ncbi:hypothetical protein V490_09047, partial [Pseudogymnoascus sp. VKM F-3557]
MAGVRVDVSAPDQLDASHEPLLACHGEVAREDLGAGLEVGLVSGVDDGVGLVVAAHQVEDPGVDAGLEGSLLSVENEADAAGGSEVADGCDGFGERRAKGQVVREVVQRLAACSGELDSHEAAGGDERDGLEGAFFPGEDLVLDGGRGGLTAGCFECGGGVGVEDDFTGVAEHDALVAHGLEGVDGAGDLCGGFASA